MPGASRENAKVSSSSLFDWDQLYMRSQVNGKQRGQHTWKAEHIFPLLHRFVTVIWLRVNVPVLSVAKSVSYQRLVDTFDY